MNLCIKAALMCLIVTSILAISGSFSYFTDEETSEKNVFTVGEWIMDEWCLEVDTSRTQISYTDLEPKLHLTEFRNRCDHPITIDTIMLDVVWFDEAGEAYNEEVLGRLCDGSAPQVQYEWDFDYVVEPMADLSQDGWRKLTFSFTKPIEEEITITFTMSDGSIKIVHWEA